MPSCSIARRARIATGLTAALLLSVLGVDDETILRDYELTNQFRAERRAVLRRELGDAGVDFERFLPFFTAVPEVLAAALADLRARWGSVERYLEVKAGVDGSTFDALRHELLMP
jgi:protein-tyrosine phosphatase